MFQPTSSPFAGLVKVILVLVALGLFTGIALSGTDLTNFITNSAKAQAITQQNDLQAQKDAIDIKYYQATQEMQMQSKQDQMRADQDAYKRSLDQDLQIQAQKKNLELETARIGSYLKMTAEIFLTICLGIGLIILTVYVGKTLQITAQGKVTHLVKWQNLDWRKQQIEISRQRERAQRKSLINTLPKVPAFYSDEAPIPWNIPQKQYAKVEKP